MCTLTWISSADGYTVFCNRDEMRTRALAIPPALHLRQGVRCIFPIDPDSGGSWIGANEHGLTACLLNGDESRCDANRLFSSRGTLLTAVIASRTPMIALYRLAGQRLGDFRPFRLALFAPAKPVLLVSWDGQTLDTSVSMSEQPLTSSTIEVELVQQQRRERYLRLIAAGAHDDAGAHMAYHADHGDGASGRTVCMHRPDAQTVSFSRVRVTSASVDFLYLPGPPCRTRSRTSVLLARPVAGAGQPPLLSMVPPRSFDQS